MVEYNYEEALKTLKDNLRMAVEQLTETNEDLAFLKDQITTTEVNISRTYNHGVKLKREEKSKKQVTEESDQ